MTPADMEGFKAIPYTPGDEQAILPFLKVALGESSVAPRSEKFWRWKHLENPFGRSCGSYALDVSSGRIAALRMLMRWSFTGPEGTPVKALRAVDTATHPDFRRRGLFSSLTARAVEDQRKEEAGLIFNTPNGKSLPGYLKMGWTVVDRPRMLLKILNPGCLLRAALRAGRGTSTTSTGPWETFFPDGVWEWRAFESHYGSRFVDSFIMRSESGRERKGYRTPRSVAYLRWRYGGHPTLKYGIIAEEDEEGLAGVAILRPGIRGGAKELMITELFLDGADPERGRRFLEKMIVNVKADYLVAGFSESSFEKELLRRCSFRVFPLRPVIFTARPLGSLPVDPTRAKAWDLSLGDLELF